MNKEKNLICLFKSFIINGYCIWIYRENFLDIEDLKKCTQFLEQNFSEDELEELLELSGKSNGKLTFDNFM